MSMGSPLDARPRRLQTFFDPLTPEYDAMVRCHNVEYPIKHPTGGASGCRAVWGWTGRATEVCLV